VAPAGLPKPIAAKLNEKLIEAMRSPEIRQRISAQMFELWTSTPEEFARGDPHRLRQMGDGS
jgi:tripartite-type tricarboxylate transporter receptor subunit TctC